MANKAKLREILDILSPQGTAVDFKAFDEGVSKLKTSLKEKIQAKTLDDVNAQLLRLKKSIDFEPVLTALKEADKNFEIRIKVVSEALATEVSKIEEVSKGERRASFSRAVASQTTVEALRFELQTLKKQKNEEISRLTERLNELPLVKELAIRSFSELKARLDRMEEATEPDIVSPLKKEIQDVRSELISKIQSASHGDHANRNIAIGGNTSVLSVYTDVNLIAGSGVAITATRNRTTKYTDVTLSAAAGNLVVLIPTSGVIDGVNTIFTFATAPTLVVVDNANTFNKQNMAPDSTANWTGTTTITLNVAPTFNLYAF